MNKFLDVVPKGVKVSAPILMVGFMVLGSVAGGLFPRWGDGGAWHTPVVASVAMGAVGGLAMGAFLAVWMLCLGYVYEDAKRRAMRPVLWTLIAALFPHLFGFLLYFALRQPMTPRCPKCGQPVTLDQRFCSWCGAPAPAPAVGGAAAGTGASGVGSVPAV
jgi:zinc-ribbon domain/Phospholipase_D-nuclease N-terminal